MTLICEALHAPRSSVYAVGMGSAPADRRKRGPKTALADEELGTVSRETQVPVHELERWRRIFLEGDFTTFNWDYNWWGGAYLDNVEH